MTDAFVVYAEGVALKLEWPSGPPACESPHYPVRRLCALSDNLLLLLTADGCLYSVKPRDGIAEHWRLELLDVDVNDVAYCRRLRQLYLVKLDGAVRVEQIDEQNMVETLKSVDKWQILSFDPLELSEDGIKIERVCCAEQGVLFITQRGEVYVMGSCGEVFTSEAQPKHLRLFDENLSVLDLAAGDEFFVLLLKRAYEQDDDALESFDRKRQRNRASPSNASPSRPATTHALSFSSTPNLEVSASADTERNSELNSNSSLHSLSSSKSSNYQDLSTQHQTNLERLIRAGYLLIQTQVHTFGAVNNGLLGTGDHIKRSSVHNVQKLEAVGVCSVAAGREHSVARTLDGRLFHWGLNTQQQLNGKKDIIDLSAPTEFKLDEMELDEQQRSVLEACCGDYQTVLVNARGELHEKNKQLYKFERDFLTLHLCDTRKMSFPLLLASGGFTVYNRQQFQSQHYACLSNLQHQLKMLLKYRHAVRMMQMCQKNTPMVAFKNLQLVCLNYSKVLYTLAALLESFEKFYRNDYDNPADLCFIKYHRDCIELFKTYTMSFCDVYSIDGFWEASKQFTQIAQAPLLPDCGTDVDLVQVFRQPLQIFPIINKFLEELAKIRHEFKEHLLAWQSCAQESRIEQELAENTLDFWQRNERNLKIRLFRRRQRRVILTSTMVPLKLTGSVSMTSTTFILFSDCLCQVGSKIYTFPLTTMWLKKESETYLRIITPEHNFVVAARSHDHKTLWYNQLESSIIAALCRPPGSELSNVRTTFYAYSKSHTKYAGVNAYGRWRNGVLHGHGYLEYPDGKVYYGEMRNGEIEGYGRMITPSVGLYEGTFKAGKFHGHGTYEMKDNEIYEGNFRDGLFHGHGLMRGNNYTYVGEYQAHSRCGYGILDDTLSGDKYMGMFAINKRTGAGTCITMNGDYFEGIFVNDELSGTGIAVFENDYYYEGELTMRGPNGKGTYYMPTGIVDGEETTLSVDDDSSNRQMVGNILSGQLGGSWQDVRIASGNVSMHKHFPKFPKSIGDLVVDNNRKWRSLFENFEEQVLNTSAHKTFDTSSNSTRHLWNRIAVFMTTQRERQKVLELQNTAYQSTHSYFAKNIAMGYNNNSQSATNNTDKVSLKSTTSLLNTAKSSILDLSISFTVPKRSHSQETLYETDTSDFDFCYSLPNQQQCEEQTLSAFWNTHQDVWADDSTTSLSSSFDSVMNISGSYNNNNNNSYTTSQSGLEFVPSFGINSLNEQDVIAIKEYLAQAFKDRHHPLYILNQRIANCFYTSYGCWKVKPTPLLAKQAMREWESISKRVYKFVRKMFPALPEDYCIIECSREVISHITLLYPIVLSEGIYSTLFVLYANKYSRKDEMYRQNLLYAEKLDDQELATCLGLESNFLPVVSNSFFADAIQSLRQLQEKYSPKAMLTVIERCMQQITDAHKMVENETTVILAADSMMPLTLFLVLRAGVPHLGAELALLDDLTGGANFQFEMNGLAGYCYTTLKACYEHITAKPLNKT